MLKTDHPELFDEPDSAAGQRKNAVFGPGGFSADGFDIPDIRDMPPLLSKLFELSVNAFYAVICAEMSGLPIKEEIFRFARKAGSAPDREAADRIASDRGDPDVLSVLGAARKVQHEIHRIMGFLRFSPDARGVYTARCAPEYFILPALAEHFTLRFGETPWAVIDEKRNLRLSREPGGEARLGPDRAAQFTPEETGDSWEELWRLYHRSVNNEGRKNLKLQRQFMPERYRKYLTELSGK